jgi:hypothetical protein
MFRNPLLPLAVAALTVCTSAGLSHGEELPVDGAGRGHLTLFDTHDLVLVGAGGNHVGVTVMMFSDTQFEAIPQLGYVSLEELAEMASRVLHFQCLLSDLEHLTIECGGGHDMVATDFGFPVPLTLYGEDGDDCLQGGANADILSGDDGDDWLDGFGDGRQDTLKGGDDCDTFIQYYRLVRGTRYGTVRIAEERILDVTVKDEVVDVYGE